MRGWLLVSLVPFSLLERNRVKRRERERGTRRERESERERGRIEKGCRMLCSSSGRRRMVAAKTREEVRRPALTRRLTGLARPGRVRNRESSEERGREIE